MKSALVVGATSDIGVEISKQLESMGFVLHLTGKSEQSLSALKSKLLEPSKVHFYPLDILDLESIPSFVHSLPTDIEICFFLPAYYGDQTAARISQRELIKTTNTNYVGALLFCNELSLSWEKRGYGTLVGISSVAGERGRKINYIYGSTKAGLSVYLSGLRSELYPKGVHITTIQLGPVYTKMSQGHNLIPGLTLSAKKAATKIILAGFKKKDIAYIHWIWYWILLLIRSLPECIFKRLPKF